MYSVAGQLQASLKVESRNIAQCRDSDAVAQSLKYGAASKEPTLMGASKQSWGSILGSATVPELEQSKAAVLGALASIHSRRAYKRAIDQFIDWYCSEPRLGLTALSFCDTGRFLRAFRFPPRPSISIFQPSAAWLMRLRKAAGWARS